MKIFILESDLDRYQSISCKDEKDVKKFMYWHGQPLAHMWKVIEVEIPEEDLEAWESDFPGFGGTPTFSQRAVETLRDVLEGNGELLPVKRDSQTYFCYNVTNIVDALDPTESTFDEYGAVETHCFSSRKVKDQLIFKLPHLLPKEVKLPWPHIKDRRWLPPGRQVTQHDVYVSDVFVQRVRAADLRGFEFERVWEDKNLKHSKK
jgi:hypothetical protein